MYLCVTNRVEVCAEKGYCLGACGCGSYDRNVPVAPRIGDPDQYDELWASMVVGNLCWARHWGVTRANDETKVTMQSAWIGKLLAIVQRKDNWRKIRFGNIHDASVASRIV